MKIPGLLLLSLIPFIAFSQQPKDVPILLEKKSINSIRDLETFIEYGKYGLRDRNYDVLIKPTFDQLEKTDAPYVIAKQNGKYGILSQTGKVVIDFMYDAIHFRNISGKDAYEQELTDKDFLFEVRKKGLEGLIDIHNKEILPVQYRQVANRYVQEIPFVTDYYVVTDSNHKEGVFNAKLRVLLIPPRYDQILDENQGHYIAVNNKKYGIINSKNQVPVPFQYDYLHYFSLKNRQAPLLALSGNKYGLINIANQKLAGFKYDNIYPVNNGLYCGCTGKQCRLMDAYGHVLDTASYDNIGVFVNGQATVFRNGKIGYINVKGKLVTTPLNPAPGRGYNNLNELCNSFARLLKLKNDSLLLEFCKDIIPDQHTINFLDRAKYDYMHFNKEVKKGEINLEGIMPRFTKIMNQLYADIDKKGGIDKLVYVGMKKQQPDIKKEEYGVESVHPKLIFQLGNETFTYDLGLMARMDGIWKSFTMPSRSLTSLKSE